MNISAVSRISLLVWAGYCFGMGWDPVLALSVPSVGPRRNQGDQLGCELLTLQDPLICPKSYL